MTEHHLQPPPVDRFIAPATEDVAEARRLGVSARIASLQAWLGAHSKKHRRRPAVIAQWESATKELRDLNAWLRATRTERSLERIERELPEATRRLIRDLTGALGRLAAEGAPVTEEESALLARATSWLRPPEAPHQGAERATAAATEPRDAGDGGGGGGR